MKKWIFVNNITSLDKLYYLTKTVSENIVTENNHARLLMNALNANGANRNEANNHPINYTLFYDMTYFDGNEFKLTANGERLLKEYEKIKNNKKYRAEFFFTVLNNIEYPNMAVETSDIYQIHPINMLFKLMCDFRLNSYITIDEFENLMSMAYSDNDYEKIVNIILKYRSGENVDIECEKIAQVTTVVAGWCNQFNVMKREGEKIMLSDDLKSMLPILSNEIIINKLPYSMEFISFVLKKYLFEGSSMEAIENEFYNKTDRRGFLAKDVLDYYQINNKENKAMYNEKSLEFVCSLLDIQSDQRYQMLSNAIKGNKNGIEESPEEKSIIEKFIKFYNANLAVVKEKENIASIELRKEFLAEYPIERFKTLDLREYSMGLDDDSTFCRKVEGGKYKSYGVKCSGDPNGAAHWGIFYSKEKQAYLDNDYNVLDKPDEYWNRFRNELYDYLINLNNERPNFSDSYPMLKNLSKTLPKLCFMYYPNKFLNFVTKAMLQEIYDVFELKYNNSTPADQLSFELNKYIRENVPNAEDEASEYISSLLWEFKERFQESAPIKTEMIRVDDIDRVTGGYNKIYYGVPGSGKSYKVNEEFNSDNYEIYRTTFHPEYTNSDFIGQIIPMINDNNVEYKFHAGAFTLALEDALNNKGKKVCLIIEEINRGNSSAIFGDIFQLLDRDKKGKSKYSIFNGPIIDYLKTHYIDLPEVYIPSNLWIVATMNTSDQNVFTLDTAFKRRWKMEYIKNVFADNEESIALKNKIIRESSKYPNVTWGKFVNKINKHIISDVSGINGEDKQLGMYFVSIEEIADEKEFAEKILSYLWEDVAKINTSYWFGSISSYDELIEAYNKNYLDVFNTLFEDDIEETNEYTIVGE